MSKSRHEISVGGGDFVKSARQGIGLPLLDVRSQRVISKSTRSGSNLTLHRSAMTLCYRRLVEGAICYRWDEEGRIACFT